MLPNKSKILQMIIKSLISCWTRIDRGTDPPMQTGALVGVVQVLEAHPFEDEVQPTVFFKTIQPIPHNNLQQAKTQPGNTQELIQEPQVNTVSCKPVTTKVAGRIQHFSQAWKQMTSDKVIFK